MDGRALDGRMDVGRGVVKASCYLPLAGVVAVEAVWLASRDRWQGPVLWVPLVGALVAHAALVVREHHRPRLGPAPILLATVAVGAVAVWAPPFGSKDVYLYGMYGRIVEHYHASPYVHPPQTFAGDPLLRFTSVQWHSTRDVYGPLFTALSALGATVYGSSAWAARTWFQLLDLVALLGIVLVLARRQVSGAVLVAVALAPPMLAVVNNGHNDPLIGLLVLVAVLLALDRRPVPTGLALGAAGLVKVLALPVAAGVVVAFLLAKRWRDAAVTAATTAAVLVAGYGLAGGGRALAPLQQNTANTTRLSVWYVARPLFRALGDPDFGIGPGGRSTMLHVAFVGVAVVVVMYFARSRRGDDPVALMLGPLLLFLLVGAYALPAYFAMLLPAAVLATGWRFRALAFVPASVYLLAYVEPLGRHPNALAPPLTGTVRAAVPWVCAVVAVALVTWSAREAPAIRWWSRSRADRRAQNLEVQSVS